MHTLLNTQKHASVSSHWIEIGVCGGQNKDGKYFTHLELRFVIFLKLFSRVAFADVTDHYVISASRQSISTSIQTS
jgi:hypothetical protein